MARAADRGRAVVTTPSRPWPTASTVLLIGLALGYLMAEISSGSGEGIEALAAVAVDGGDGPGGAIHLAPPTSRWAPRSRVVVVLAEAVLMALSRHRS